MSDLLAGRRILIVEDEMLILMNIEIAIRELGCAMISSAATVSGALVLLLTDQNFDAALVDVNLGGENSYPIAERLRECGIPFAFSTGYGSHGDRKQFEDRPLLRKPYVRADLVRVIEQMMMERSLPAAA